MSKRRELFAQAIGATAAAGVALGTIGAGHIHTRIAVRHVSAAASTLNVLHSFNGADGANPQGGIEYVLRPSSSKLVGATQAGGSSGNGTLFAQPVQGSAAFATLLSFNGADGAVPSGGLAGAVSDYTVGGPVFGVTSTGGQFGYGAIYEATTNGAQTVLYSFTGGVDGANPAGRLVLFTDGKLYGTTSAGAKGFGTVFVYSLKSGFRTIHTFRGGNDGATPLAGLTLRLTIPSSDSAARRAALTGGMTDASRVNAQYVAPVLYGTASNGGAAGTANGTLFSIAPSGTFTTLFTFADTVSAPGATPSAELTSDFNGNLYGSTAAGGSAGLGEIFAYSAQNALSIVHDFGADPDSGIALSGATPLAPLTLGFNGSLYGTTSSGSVNGLGNIFMIDASGFALKYEFSGPDGASPQTKLVDGLNGSLYGTTNSGGSNGLGEIFSIAE